MTYFKRCQQLWAIARVYSVLGWWLLVTSLMMHDYLDAIKNPPIGFIPSSYEPPHGGLLAIGLTLIILELGIIYAVLRPWQQKNHFVRLIFLASLNLVWLFVVGLATRSRSPSPMIWHFGWLLVLEVMWIIEIISSGLFHLVRYSCHMIHHR